MLIHNVSRDYCSHLKDVKSFLWDSEPRHSGKKFAAFGFLWRFAKEITSLPFAVLKADLPWQLHVGTHHMCFFYWNHTSHNGDTFLTLPLSTSRCLHFQVISDKKRDQVAEEIWPIFWWNIITRRWVNPSGSLPGTNSFLLWCRKLVFLITSTTFCRNSDPN